MEIIALQETHTGLSSRKMKQLPPSVWSFHVPPFVRLAFGLCWWMVHLFLCIHHFGSRLLQVIECYIFSIGLRESYLNLPLNKLRYLAVVVDSKEARNTLKIKKLLLWLSKIGVNHVILYDMEGVLKKSLDGDLTISTSGTSSVTNQNRMTIELLSFDDSKGGVAKAASFIFTKYLRDELASCDKEGPNITEAEMSDALKAVGCGGPEPDILLIYGPTRCHLGFPAWRMRYTEIIHMGSLKSMKYGAILKTFYEFSEKQQNYGT